MPWGIMKSVSENYATITDYLERAEETTGKTKTLKWFYRRHGNQNPFALLQAAALGFSYLYPQISFNFYPHRNQLMDGKKKMDRFTEFLGFIEKHYQGGIVYL